MSKFSLGPEAKGWLAAAGVGLAALAAVRFIHAPLWQHLGVQRAMREELRVRIADARQAVSQQLPDETQALDAIRRRSSDIEARLGARQSVARILEALSAQAKAQRCELVVVQPRAGAQQARSVMLGGDVRLREIPLHLKLAGRYAQLGEFLGWMPNAPFFGTVRSVSVSQPDAANPQLQADIELAIYVSEESST